MKDSKNLDLASAIEVVAGNPTAKELAALVAVLSEAAGSDTQSVTDEPNWARGSKLLRGAEGSSDLQWKSNFKGEI